jgi:hypothetical protein
MAFSAGNFGGSIRTGVRGAGGVANLKDGIAHLQSLCFGPATVAATERWPWSPYYGPAARKRTQRLRPSQGATSTAWAGAAVQPAPSAFALPAQGSKEVALSNAPRAVFRSQDDWLLARTK